MSTPITQSFNSGLNLLVQDMVGTQTVDLRDEFLRTPLMIAAASKNMGALTSLIAAGAAVDLVDKDGRSALHYAVIKGNIEAIEALLVAGAAVNIADIRGYTPLHRAAEREDTAIALLLKKNGADCLAVTESGETPLLIAKMTGNKELYKQLKPVDKRVYYYSKELRLRTHLAHMLNIAGTTTLKHPNPAHVEQVTVDLEGWHPPDFLSLINKRTQAFCRARPNEFPDIVLDVLNTRSYTPEQLFKHYSEEKKPIIISTGFHEHHSCVILWGSFFVLCERAIGKKQPFEIVAINKKLITEAFITELTSLKIRSREEYIAFFKVTMNEYYAKEQHPISFMLQNLISLPLLEMGNCSWANSVAGVYALLILESIRQNAARGVSEQSSLEELCKNQNLLFAKWQSFVTGITIKKYIKCHTKLPRVIAELYKAYYPPDPKFIA